MNKDNMIRKIKEELQEICNKTEELRNKKMSLGFKKILQKDKNKDLIPGSVESVYYLKTLLTLEDQLRKEKDNLEEWPKSLKLLTSKIEEFFDNCFYCFDYEIVDNYSVKMIVNERLCICFQMVKSGCRCFNDDKVCACIIKWGSMDLSRQKYTDAFKADKQFNVADNDATEKFIDEAKKTITKYRIKMCP